MDNKDKLKEKIKEIPLSPGIYKMLDSRGNIIYIGKSKCLRKRVKTYFVENPKWEKVNRMITVINDIDYIVTDTHLEARLLECVLIKEHKPHFNAQMKNDRKYFFIKVDNYNRYNPLKIVDERTENCFGPFRSRFTIAEFTERLKNIYPLVKNNGTYEFDYHIFPVVMEEKIYELNKALLLELFHEEDNILLLVEALRAKLEEAAAAFRYEAAAVYRDMIGCFMMLQRGLDGYKALKTRKILLKIPLEEGYKLFLISDGEIINSMVTKGLTERIKNKFTNFNISKAQLQFAVSLDEKERIDYRDVLYSEISDLPDEMVEFL